MSKRIFLILFMLVSSLSFSQSLFKDFYLSSEFVYRSYGKGDQIGNGFGLEYSKDLKKWLGGGINLSYWNNKAKSWDFRNPFTNEHFIYMDKIEEVRIHPFIQLIPLNTTPVDFYVQLGFSTGYFNHIYWSGGYTTIYNPDEFYNYVRNEGYKGIYLGYDIGLAIRLEFGKFIIIPNAVKSFNFQEEDGFDSLNLKIGWHF